MIPTVVALFWLVILTGLGWWMLGTPRQAQLPPSTEAELARLREEVDRLSEQVGRLTEEQSYMTRLLASREQHPSLPTPETRDADA